MCVCYDRNSLCPSVHCEHFAYFCVAPVATLIWGRNLESPIPLETFVTRYSPEKLWLDIEICVVL